MRVIIIGAGFGGIGMAIALKQAGIDDFVVLDRADDIGGTWRDNSYPGLTCDVPSQLYSFSFRPWRWSRRFPAREEILAYLRALVAEHGLGPHLSLGRGVAAAEFDERGCASSSTVSCSPAASSCRRSCWPGPCSCGAASSGRRSPIPGCAPSASPTT